jgi:hypothetical protein
MIGAASALMLLAIVVGAGVAIRDEAEAPEQRGESGFLYRIGPVTHCGEPPYKPCPTVGIESVATVPLQE